MSNHGFMRPTVYLEVLHTVKIATARSNRHLADSQHNQHRTTSMYAGVSCIKDVHAGPTEATTLASPVRSFGDVAISRNETQYPDLSLQPYDLLQVAAALVDRPQSCGRRRSPLA